MDFLLEVSPEFSMSSDDFVQLWNSELECSAVATARLPSREAPQPRYDGGLTLLAILGAISLHVSAATVHDLLKKLFNRQKRVEREQEFEIVTVERPDGTNVTKIRVTTRQ